MVDISVGRERIEGIGLIIFDKDGTLIELYHYWSEMVGLRARLICERLDLDGSHIEKIAYAMGVDFGVGRLRPMGPVGLRKREIVMEAAVDYLTGLGKKNTANLCFDVFREVDEISLGRLNEFVRSIGGAERLVRLASQQGCKIAIATTDRRERARLAFQSLGLLDSLDLIVGADDVAKQKPDPEQVHLILERLKVDRNNAVMVGDALTDVQMGILAGLRASIGVLTGFASKDELMKVTPYVAGDVAEIEIHGRGDKDAE